MWKLFNFKWDKRTLYNVLKFPFIITLRVPFVLLLWFAEWVVDWSEIIADKLPTWETRDTKPTEWY